MTAFDFEFAEITIPIDEWWEEDLRTPRAETREEWLERLRATLAVGLLVKEEMVKPRIWFDWRFNRRWQCCIARYERGERLLVGPFFGQGLTPAEAYANWKARA